MRTTLTLDDDVAALLDAIRQRRGISLKTAVNVALRQGLEALEEDRPTRSTFVQTTISAGGCRLENFDNISEVLAVVEGDDHR